MPTKVEVLRNIERALQEYLEGNERTKLGMENSTMYVRTDGVSEGLRIAIRLISTTKSFIDDEKPIEVSNRKIME